MREHVRVVPAFEHSHEPPVAAGIGPFKRISDEIGEAGHAQVEPSDGIAPVGVVAGRDEDHLGAEPQHAGREDAPKGRAEGVVAGAGGEGKVDRGAAPAPVARLVRCAGAGVERVLVRADEEHVRVLVEDLLGAVAVVHVDVEDDEAFGAERGPGPANGQSHVGEQAEAHGGAGPGVVAGRPDGREAVVRLAFDDGPRDAEHGPERPEGDVEALGRDVRVRIQAAAALPRRGLQPPEIVVRVHEARRVRVGRDGLGPVQAVPQRVVPQERQDGVEPGRALGVTFLGVGFVAGVVGEGGFHGGLLSGVVGGRSPSMVVTKVSTSRIRSVAAPVSKRVVAS